jgi:hypothetical protein
MEALLILIQNLTLDERNKHKDDPKSAQQHNK